MRVTGWTPAVLRAQPASVIRAHFARIFAGLAWSPELASAAQGPAPVRSSYSSIADWAAARSARSAALSAYEAMVAAFWPEDDTDG
jgi:hypothetical protein